jgi:DNA-binding NarL/FixJ family response regulator
MLAQGKSNGEIARELVVSQNTVKTHLSHVYGKLGVASRTQALVLARELGLVQ